jgi:hypothetical protein
MTFRESRYECKEYELRLQLQLSMDEQMNPGEGVE